MREIKRRRGRKKVESGKKLEEDMGLVKFFGRKEASTTRFDTAQTSQSIGRLGEHIIWDFWESGFTVELINLLPVGNWSGWPSAGSLGREGKGREKRERKEEMRDSWPRTRKAKLPPFITPSDLYYATS